MFTDAGFVARIKRLLGLGSRGKCPSCQPTSGAVYGPVDHVSQSPRPDGLAPIPAISDRAQAWAKVRHKDENNHQRRRVQAENAASLRLTLSKGR